MNPETNNDKPEIETNPNPFSKIKTFYLGGFKAFKDIQTIPIRPITLVFGPNSAGKSSLLQGLLFALEGENTPSADIGKDRDYINSQSIYPRIGIDFNEKKIDYGKIDIGNFDTQRLLRDKEYEITSNNEFSKNKLLFERTPENYDLKNNSIRIFFDADPGWSFRLEDADVQQMYSVDQESDPEDPDYFYSRSMPLRFNLVNQNIKVLESQYKDILIDKIKYTYTKLGMDFHEIDYYISCIEGEISSLSARYSQEYGRIIIEKMSNESVWFRKCTNEMVKRRKTPYLDNEHIFWHERWLEKEVQKFNERDYSKKTKQIDYYSLEPYYTEKYIDLIVSDMSVIKAKLRGKTQITDKENDSIPMFGNNQYVQFQYVYSAVFAILSDINIRYMSGFSSMSAELKPKIKYIPANRAFLDEQGYVVNAWKSLIDNLSNRDMINYWLTRLTGHFRVSDAIKMYTEKQAFQIQLGKSKIGDDNLKPIIDSVIRIEDIRIPDKTFRPQDVGYGIQKLIPVIAASVYMSLEQTIFNEVLDIIAIEEPEMHLHPKLQSDLGDLFVDNVINNSEKTFILETHSEHLLLRILKRVRKGHISKDAISVLYVHPGEGENGVNVEELKLGDDADFLRPWPPGFFDVRHENLF